MLTTTYYPINSPKAPQAWSVVRCVQDWGALRVPRDIERTHIANGLSKAQAYRAVAKLTGRPKTPWLHDSTKLIAWLQARLDAGLPI